MDQIENALEKQLAQVRKMLAMLQTGGIMMRSQGRDVTREMAGEYQTLVDEAATTLQDYRGRNA